MKNYKFKTNINCSGCVSQVTPALNSAEGIKTWSVDISSKEKVLSVETNSFSESEIVAVVEKAGYKAEAL